MDLCKILKCKNIRKKNNNLCEIHYYREKHNLNTYNPRKKRGWTKCQIEYCNNKWHIKKLCKYHYKIYNKYRYFGKWAYKEKLKQHLADKKISELKKLPIVPIIKQIKINKSIERKKQREYFKKLKLEQKEREKQLKLLYKKENQLNSKIAHNLRSRLYNAIKRNQKIGSAIRDLGCTIEELKQYIESKFQSEMTWDNYGLYGWHIDHIIPLCQFNLSNKEEFFKAVHYTNLQPLWAKYNLKKLKKY